MSNQNYKQSLEEVNSLIKSKGIKKVFIANRFGIKIATFTRIVNDLSVNKDEQLIKRILVYLQQINTDTIEI